MHSVRLFSLLDEEVITIGEPEDKRVAISDVWIRIQIQIRILIHCFFYPMLLDSDLKKVIRGVWIRIPIWIRTSLVAIKEPLCGISASRASIYFFSVCPSYNICYGKDPKTSFCMAQLTCVDGPWTLLSAANQYVMPIRDISFSNPDCMLTIDIILCLPGQSCSAESGIFNRFCV